MTFYILHIRTSDGNIPNVIQFLFQIISLLFKHKYTNIYNSNGPFPIMLSRHKHFKFPAVAGSKRVEDLQVLPSVVSIPCVTFAIDKLSSVTV